MDNPYPDDATKACLAAQTSLTVEQISNWFVNARMRILTKTNPAPFKKSAFRVVHEKEKRRRKSQESYDEDEEYRP